MDELYLQKKVLDDRDIENLWEKMAGESLKADERA